MATNNFNEVIESLFKGMDSFVSAKTVVGEAVTVGDTIIVPLVDISFGVAAGAGLNDDKKKNNGGGGMGAKMSPNAVLVISNGSTRLVNVKSQDAINKVLDMVPDVIERFAPGSKKEDPAVEDAIREAAGRE